MALTPSRSRSRSRSRSWSWAWAWALALFAVAGCSSSPIEDISRMDTDRVPAALQKAQSVTIEEASDKELIKVVASMLSAKKATDLDTNTRVAVVTMLDSSASEFAARGTNVAALEDLALTDLPARISVKAGLRAAHIYFDDDERSDAFKLIRKIDLRYPSHGQRVEAGDLISDIADSYKNDKRRRLFLFPYSNRAPGVYEYLSTEYPTHPKSDDALNTLAEIYESKRRFDVAIDKREELILMARDSPFRIASEAAIPRLRLADLDGPEYGRDSMLRALTELERWLAEHQIDEGRIEVERTLVDCLQRLADNDMGVAHFYRTVGSVTGARQHAARALGFANRAGNEEQLTEIRTFLTSLDEIEVLGAPREIPEAMSPEGMMDSAGGGFETDGPADLAPGSSVIQARRTPRKTEKAIKDAEEEAATGAPEVPPGVPPTGTDSGGGNG